MFQFNKSCKFITILKVLLPYLWVSDIKLRCKLFFSIIFNLLAIFSSICTPIIFSHLIDYVNSSSPKSISWFLTFLLMYIGIWTFGKLFLYLREIMMFPVMERAIRLLAFSLFRHIQLLPFQYHLKRKTGEITGIIETAIQSFPPIVWSLAFALCPLIIESIFVIIIVSVICGISYSLLLFMCLLLYLLVTYWGVSKVITPLRQANISHLEATSKIVDSFLNFSSIKYFHTYNFEFKKIEHILNTREVKIAGALIQDQMIKIYQMAILSFSFLLLIVFTGYNLMHNKLSLGEFIMIHTYMIQFTIPLESFGQMLQMLNQSFVKMERAFKIFRKSPDNKNGTILLSKEEPLHIIFEDVWFSHQEGAPILKGVSFELHPKKTLAIVGETGSGKSTIISLLLGFIEPCKGRIVINGVDLKYVNKESFINLVGIVPQDVTLFNDTLSHNILYADRSASHERLMNAVQIANLNETIQKLPNGLETIVGEQGDQLSGGERQRIGLARAIIRQPKLYIFDEATSSLDSKTEKNIIKNIEKIASNASTIIIAHRLSTVAFADHIILLENGIIKDKNYTSLIREHNLH